MCIYEPGLFFIILFYCRVTRKRNVFAVIVTHDLYNWINNAWNILVAPVPIAGFNVKRKNSQSRL